MSEAKNNFKAVLAAFTQTDNEETRVPVMVTNPPAVRDFFRYSKILRTVIKQVTSQDGQVTEEQKNTLAMLAGDAGCEGIMEVTYVSVNERRILLDFILIPAEAKNDEHLLISLILLPLSGELCVNFSAETTLAHGDEVHPDEVYLDAVTALLGVVGLDVEEFFSADTPEEIRNRIYQEVLMIVSDFLDNAGREWREGVTLRNGEFVRSGIERSYPVQANLAASLLVMAEILADESSMLMVEAIKNLQRGEDESDDDTYEDPEDNPVDDGDEEGFGLIEARARNIKLH